MSLLVILILALTSRIFAVRNTTLQSDSVSSKVDRKSPQISSFNFSKDTHTQHRFGKYDVNSTRRTMNEVIINRTKAIKSTFLDPRKQFSISRTQVRRPNDEMKKWKREKLKKRRKTYPKQISDVLVLVVDATQLEGANVDKVTENSSQSRTKLLDWMKLLFLRKLFRNAVETVLTSDSTVRHFGPRTRQEMRNGSNSIQLDLPQQYSVSPSKAPSSDKVTFGKTVRRKMLQLLAKDEMSMKVPDLFVKCRISRKVKSLLAYKRCCRIIETMFNRSSGYDAFKQTNPTTSVSLLDRSKRQANSSVETRTKPTQTKAMNELERKQVEVVKLLMDEILKDLETENGKSEVEQKKLVDKLNLEKERLKADVMSNATDAKIDSYTVPRALNGSSDDESLDRFGSAQLQPPPPQSQEIVIIRTKKLTTTMKPCRKDDTLYALVIGFGVSFILILCAIFAVVCFLGSPSDRTEREPLIIYTRHPGSRPERPNKRFSDRRRRRRYDGDDGDREDQRRRTSRRQFSTASIAPPSPDEQTENQREFQRHGDRQFPTTTTAKAQTPKATTEAQTPLVSQSPTNNNKQQPTTTVPPTPVEMKPSVGLPVSQTPTKAAAGTP